jgi:hypothetical protein
MRTRLTREQWLLIREHGPYEIGKNGASGATDPKAALAWEEHARCRACVARLEAS